MLYTGISSGVSCIFWRRKKIPIMCWFPDSWWKLSFPDLRYRDIVENMYSYFLVHKEIMSMNFVLLKSKLTNHNIGFSGLALKSSFWVQVQSSYTKVLVYYSNSCEINIEYPPLGRGFGGLHSKPLWGPDFGWIMTINVQFFIPVCKSISYCKIIKPTHLKVKVRVFENIALSVFSNWQNWNKSWLYVGIEDKNTFLDRQVLRVQKFNKFENHWNVQLKCDSWYEKNNLEIMITFDVHYIFIFYFRSVYLSGIEILNFNEWDDLAEKLILPNLDIL